jgi:hypothetical protein
MDKDTEHIYNKLFAPELIPYEAFEDCAVRHLAAILVVGFMYLWVIGIMVSYWIDCGG